MFSAEVASFEPRASVTGALTRLLAQVLVVQLRTKGFHWHVTGPHFRSLHSLFDEQAAQLADLADAVAERSRSLGSPTISSFADVIRLDIGTTEGPPRPAAAGMVIELGRANLHLSEEIKALRRVADGADDIVTVSLADGWLVDTDHRVWMLNASVQEP